MLDVHSLDVRILDTRQWSKRVSREMKDLDAIMNTELDYYFDNKKKIYNRLKSSYYIMTTSVTTVDSLTKEIIKMVRRMKKSKSANLESNNKKADMTYREIFIRLNSEIQKSQLRYSLGIKGLRKGFKKGKKRLIFIKEISVPLKKELYQLKYKRELIQPQFDRFNQMLNEAIFQEHNSAYSIKIQKLSKKMEKFKLELNSYENFISRINVIARKEGGGTVFLIHRRDGLMNYEKKMIEGKTSYLETLKDISKMMKTI